MNRSDLPIIPSTRVEIELNKKSQKQILIIEKEEVQMKGIRKGECIK